ncbi:MAG: TonB family protein [Acidobacteria bacterium]|nr:TonB family protein [Acidobacteriota bacterium]
MRIISLTLIALLWCLPLAFTRAETVEAFAEAADVVFKNGNIYTVNDKQARAEALAVKAGKIIFVGSNKDAKAYEGKATKIVDLKGNTVVPGLTDSHYHLIGVGQREMTLNLEGTNTLDEFLARIKERVDKTKVGEWVTGRGWIETFWKPQAFPTRWDLDKIAPHNPVYLTRADGHAGVANSAAIKLAGVDKNTPNPFGGEIMKDQQTGEPNGMFLDKAQALLGSKIPAGGRADTEQAILLGVKRSLELGWTQIHDAGGSYADVELYKKLYGEGKIKLRIYKAIYGPGVNASRLMKEGASPGQFDQRFTLRTIKVVMDGALGSKGAWLLENYSDYNTAGFTTVKEEELYPMLVEALKSGIQVETHAIGDRANRVILDLYEKAFKAVPVAERKVQEPRWRIEHAQIVHPDDIPRFAKLGVIPSMQPSHAIGDLHFAPSRLGMKRLAGAYAWESFIKLGCKVAGGSDAPVERGEPMIEFYAAVSRKDMKGFTGEGWHPEQKVSRQDALKMFTLWAANAAFEEKSRGSIEVGKFADLTVLSADIMKIAEPEILKTRCIMTVIGGEVVYDATVQATISTASQTAKANKATLPSVPAVTEIRGIPNDFKQQESEASEAQEKADDNSTGAGFNADGSAKSVDSKPIPLTRPRPNYPEEARRNKIEGRIRLRALVGTDGKIKEVKIVWGLPDGLNQEAEKSIRDMVFKPAMKDGRPVPYWVVMELEFNLR